MASDRSEAEKKVWKISALVELIVSRLDPLSTLRLVQEGVLDEKILEEALSTKVWNDLIKRGSYGEEGLQRRDVKNLVCILKRMKEPEARLIALLEAICEKFP